MNGRPLIPLLLGCVSMAAATAQSPVAAQDRTAPQPTAGQEPNKAKPKPQPFRWVNPLTAQHARLNLPVQHGTFTSPSMKIQVGYCIYLPPDYNDPKLRQKRYPVVYYLHGGRPGSETKSIGLSAYIDRAIRAGQVPPMIYVFVNGGPVSHYNYPQIENGMGEDVFINELIPHIDRTYRTVADRRARAIEGFSQGGRGTTRIMFKHPDLFCSAAPGGAGHATEKRISEENGRESETLVFAPGYNTYDLARAYAKLDKDARPKLRILIHVGTKGFNYENNLAYMEFLESLGIPFDRLIVEDAPHSAQVIYEKRGLEIMKFHVESFRLAAQAAFQVPAVWEYGPPLIAPEDRADEPSHAQKDPTLVFHDGRWHVFMTAKLPGRSAIEYCSFDSWDKADASKRTLLTVSDSKYFCAPQVFYFAPHEKWYLIYQVGVPGAKKMWVGYSTTTTIADPGSWTAARPILDGGPTDPRQEGGLDYWIICDDQRAYLFLTSLNGKMWRLWTRLEDFPEGFGHCQVALEAKIFEASHTYRLKGQNRYLTIVEENGRRYYKAYVADRLDGEWTPLADTSQRPFAGASNIRPAPGVERWTDNVSHGELVRDGVDQTLTVDPANLRFVFQGMLDRDKSAKGYGQFQWRIGMLTPTDDSRQRPGK